MSGGLVLMDDKGYFSKFAHTGSFWCQLPVSGDRNVLLFLAQKGRLSHGKIYNLLLDRKGEVREPFMHLLFLQHLQFKIINLSKKSISDSMV